MEIQYFNALLLLLLRWPYTVHCSGTHILLLSSHSLFDTKTSAVFQLVPVLHVRVFDLAVMMTVVSWHHGIAAGGCSCKNRHETFTIWPSKHMI